MTSKNYPRRATIANPKGIGSQGGFDASDVESRFSRARTSNANGVGATTEDGGQFTSRIPREIRTDPEIEGKLAELDQATKAYLAFDMNRF